MDAEKQQSGVWAARSAPSTSVAEYSPLVVDHFERPRNTGRFAPAGDVIAAAAGDADRGAMFHMSARVQDGEIVAVRFEVYGCPHCIAACSWLSERLPGCTVHDLEQWSWRDAGAALQVPAEKRGRLLILEDALRALAANWRRQS